MELSDASAIAGSITGFGFDKYTRHCCSDIVTCWLSLVTYAPLEYDGSMTSLPIIESPARPAERACPARSESKGSYAFVSLGCPKNLIDSERMLGLLQLDGYKLVPEPAGADFVIVNTCGFIERARQESLSTIHQMLDLKRQGRPRGVIVSGCFAGRGKGALFESPPGDHHPPRGVGR